VFEQIQRIRVRVAMIRSHFRAILEQQGITGRFRFALGGIAELMSRAMFQQQLEARTLIAWVITQIPVHENDRSTELIVSIRISAGPRGMLRRSVADPCTALPIANESRWPF